MNARLGVIAVGIGLLIAALCLHAKPASAEPVSTLSANTTTSDLQPPLRLCTLEHWPPFVDRGALNGGFAVQVVDEALTLAGIPFQRFYFPWARAVEQTKNGDCDAISELYHDPQREQWADFSVRYGDLSMTLFAHRDVALSYKTLADLKRYRIGLLRGANISPQFHRTEGLQLVSVNSVKQGLQLAYSGRIDAFVTGEKAIRFAMYQLQHELPDIAEQLVPVYPALHTNELFLGFNKIRDKNRDWRARFNRAMAELIASGRYQQILQDQHLAYQ